LTIAGKGASSRAIAAQFGVSQSTIARILRGRKWRHVPRPAEGQNGL
jgi:transposase